MAALSCDNTNVVFIDTSLDTHLALIVSDHDTVSDLKKKILSEHPLCFPKIGQIQIHGIKVMRRGYFYHLSDSMFVRSAFNGLDKSWFLSVDASPLGECGQNEQLFSHGSPNQVASLGLANNANSFPSKRLSSLDNLRLLQLENKLDVDEEIPVISPCVSEHNGKEAVKNLETVKSSGNDDTGIPLPGSIPEKDDRCYVDHEVRGSHIECEVDGSGKGIDDSNLCQGDFSLSVPSAKKKRKSKRKKEDTMQRENSKDNIVSVDDPLSFPSKGETGFNNFQVPQLENKQDEKEEIPVVRPCVSENTGKEVVKSMEMDVKSYGNNDPGIPFPSSDPETRPNSHVECEVDGSNKGIKDDSNVCEGDPSLSVPSAKKKRKSKRKKEDTVQGDNSKDNIVSVDDPLSFPSKGASGFNNFQVPQLENKQDEKEEIPIVVPCVSENTSKEVVKSMQISDTETRPNSHVECEVDGSNKGIKDDHIVCEEGASKPAPSAKKKHKSKRKKEDTVQDDTSKENDASTVVLANLSENANKEVNEETEGLKEHQHPECNNNNDKNDTDAVSMKEPSELGPTANKKHRKRKRSMTHDSKEMLKVGTASQNDEAQKSDEAHEERKDSKDQLELNNDKSRGDVEYKHNKVTEDILDTKSPAKKKQKGKEKKGEKSLSNAELINDFNVDNAFHHLLEDQQNIKKSSAGQSDEHFSDADTLRTSVRGRRKKGKINSSNLHETPVVTSSRKDEEADHSSTQREGVQEEISDNCLLSKDIIMSKTTPDNMEIGTEACKKSIQSTVKGTEDCKNHCDAEMEVLPSDANEPKDLTEDNANVGLGHCHKSEAGQAEGAKEGREVSIQNDPKEMQLEKCTPSNQDNANANITELNVTSKVVDAKGMNEPVKSEKKKRGKKTKNSGGGPALREGIDLVDASESETIIVKSLKATKRDPMSGKTETEENPLNQTEGEKIRQEEMQRTVLSVTNKEDDFSGDNADSLEQIKTKSNAERVDKGQRKKSNNRQTSTLKSTSNMLTKDQVIDSKKEHGVHSIHPDKKVPNVDKTGQDAKLSSRSDSAMSSIGEKRKPRKNAGNAEKSMDVKKRRERIPMSNSKLEGSNKMVQNKAGKASGNNVGRVVSNTQQKKSLLAGAIFKDDSSSTSEDEVDNSDASTRTPSDTSILSDFSDGDSSSGLDSQQNGSNGGKRLENGGRSSLKASLSDAKGMTIDRVLRSSTRYKKAKITASQLDESESQPEFVPDSLADM
ncbi:hypothetical protein SESBI_35452 [Sesbania bispinosa]|nr:hypothetical protein SESBI_35452 [Sesbania bispinosa]